MEFLFKGISSDVLRGSKRQIWVFRRPTKNKSSHIHAHEFRVQEIYVNWVSYK
jgi:hypothetical protein